jgi:cysteinyl-tRNA synthetase
MELCDDLRDNKLVDLGVRLEDKMDETGKPIIKLVDKATLLAEREEKEKLKAQAEEKKRLAAEKKAKDDAEKVGNADKLSKKTLKFFQPFSISG